jgi:CDP-diacylglycerol---serine O-phosphatidyltransferase
MATASEYERPPRKGIRRGIYLIPSTFTMGNILCGFYAVVDSLKGYQSIHNPERAAELFDHAAVAIGIAFLLDGLDGRLARMTNATSEFGIELDSIADVLSFGIAPALLAYAWGYGSTPGIERLAWGVSFFFLVCGALRLARFNVLARAPRFTSTGTSPKLNKRYYVGLPIPSAAALIAALAHFGPRPINSYDPSQTQLLSWLLLVLVVILAILMVSTLRYASFKDLGVRSSSPFIALPFLAAIVASIWFYSRWVLLILAIAYVAHGIVSKIWSLLRRLRRPWTGDETSQTASIES